MAKHVIILGAGASVPYGAPVMRNFLDVARELYANAAVPQHSRPAFENVFKAISKLQSVHSKAEFDLINLESIFTTFELSKTLKRFPGADSDEEISKLIDDLKEIIVLTLELKIRVPGSRGNGFRFDGGLANMLADLRSSWSNPPRLAILTFNYDLILDAAIHGAQMGVDYGLGTTESWAGLHIPLLKLHGSLNWGVEYKTRDIVPWYLQNFLTESRQAVNFDKDSDQVRINAGQHIHELINHSGKSTQIDRLPFIVPPSWNKADSHNRISRVWARAARELSEAENIYIIGYSLPETDSFFRQLYALGTVGDTLLKRFWVYNPDYSREKIFSNMLGPGARERFKFIRMPWKSIGDPDSTSDPFEHIRSNALFK